MVKPGRSVAVPKRGDWCPLTENYVLHLFSIHSCTHIHWDVLHTKYCMHMCEGQFVTLLVQCLIPYFGVFLIMNMTEGTPAPCMVLLWEFPCCTLRVCLPTTAFTQATTISITQLPLLSFCKSTANSR